MKAIIITKGQHVPSRRDFTIFITQRAKGQSANPVHCINCGRLMLETNGSVKLVVDEQVNLDDAEREGKAHVVMCKRCKSKVTVI